MPYYMPPNKWKPSDDIRLEPNAEEVLRSQTNYVVIAGPGAGKTELLAQRACYLLETNLCPDPTRILAISFKKDSAQNLRERVRQRCNKELATRFDSFTFDAFASQILDRFRNGLPEQYRPPADYNVVSSLDEDIVAKTNELRRQYASATSDKQWLMKGVSTDNILKKELCRYPIDHLLQPSNQREQDVNHLWLGLIGSENCSISFNMVKRLADFILVVNPLLLKALRLTYSYVFLDEYQDTTYIQYDLLSTCFLGSGAVITAVGDNKQSIMRWADAMPEGFDRFKTDFGGTKIQLIFNHRSDAELVRIQQSLVAAIDPNCQPLQASEKNQTGDGICAIIQFESSESEAAYVRRTIEDQIALGRTASDFCILSKKWPDKYAAAVIDELREHGFKCRIEDEYQDLMKDELVVGILAILHLACDKRSPAHWQVALNLLCALSSTSPQDERGVDSIERVLHDFLKELREHIERPIADRTGIQAIVMKIFQLYGPKAIRAYFPQYRQKRNATKLFNDLCDLLMKSYTLTGNWREAVADFEGHNTTPVMSIHKSKGLEYHTVFFIGLEDSAWNYFAQQPEENLCAFFVAFSRAKKQVYFTFCKTRTMPGSKTAMAQTRQGIASLYELLTSVGVPIREL